MAELLDETDLQILKTLQKNAKLTTKELADAVHLTPTPVFERQKRLERQGYIKKYVAVLDPEKMGQGLLVWGSFSLGGFSSTSAFSRNASGISGTGSWSPSWRGFAAGYDGRCWQASAAVGIDGCLLGAVSFLGSNGSVGANCIYGNVGKGLSLDWKRSFGHLAFFGGQPGAAALP